MRHGNTVDEKKPRLVECRWCKATVACSREELRVEADRRDGDALVMPCPECKKETWLSLRAWDALPFVDERPARGPSVNCVTCGMSNAAHLAGTEDTCGVWNPPTEPR